MAKGSKPHRIEELDRKVKQAKKSFSNIESECRKFLEEEKIRKLRKLKKIRHEMEAKIKNNLEQECLESIRDILKLHYSTLQTEMAKVLFPYPSMRMIQYELNEQIFIRSGA